MTLQGLAREIRGVLREGVNHPLADDRFNLLALRVFRFQCVANPGYRGFVERRGVDPLKVGAWEEVPALPTQAFKSAVLVSGDPAGVERVFRTSGTTLGGGRRGEHHVLDLSLYRESLLPNFRAHLLPEMGGPARPGDLRKALFLLPSPESVRDSSLSYMMGVVAEGCFNGDAGFFVGADGEIDGLGFFGALSSAVKVGQPVLVAGTAFAFVQWTEAARENGWETELPVGSRIMETGGYKGRTRELPREELYEGLGEVFGVSRGKVINEYGMTELLSQFYEPVLGEGGNARDPASEGGGTPLSDRYHRGPPWVRTRVLDPLSLAELPYGEVGVLAHLDLANLGSVSAVLTEDLGRRVPGGFQILGRSPGSEPRGCSLAMEDFLASQVEGP